MYVDKTRYLYDLVRHPKGTYFIARPRRFGKSLLISTLEELFRGSKELFQGLWIVVMLIDEYDKPLVDNLDQLAEERDYGLHGKPITLVGANFDYTARKIAEWTQAQDQAVN